MKSLDLIIISYFFCPISIKLQLKLLLRFLLKNKFNDR
jgi:hypothetical protein